MHSNQALKKSFRMIQRRSSTPVLLLLLFSSALFLSLFFFFSFTFSFWLSLRRMVQTDESGGRGNPISADWVNYAVADVLTTVEH